MNKKVSLLLILLLWLLAGCDLASNFTQAPPEETTPNPVVNGTAVATGTPAPDTTPDIAIPGTPVTQTRPTLRVWLPPEIALATEDGAAVLNAQLAAYRSNHPDIDLIVEQKAVSGQSGILNYLRTGRAVAPEILPDLIAIPTDQLSLALTEELIYPMGNLVATSQLEALYPAALNLVLKNNQVGGYPFVLTGLSHLAYNTEVVTATIPARWDNFIAQPNSLVFPANGLPGGTLGLQFYLAAGGSLTNEAGQTALQVEPLATALQQLFLAESSGFILDQSSNYSTFQESWQLFQAGSASVTLTNSEQFLRLRDENGRYQVTSVPGLERPLTPLVSGWAWAISSSDPAKQILAADLLNTLIADSNLGEWTYASNYLPSLETALNFWAQDDPYLPFVREQLNRASAMPFSGSSSIMTVLNNAVFDVITLTKTPQVAAEEAVAALQQ